MITKTHFLLGIFLGLSINSHVYAGIINSAGVLASKYNGKCIGVSVGSFSKEAAIAQNNCSGIPSEQWILKPYGDAYQIVVKHSGLCLNVSKNSIINGATLIQYTCSNTKTGLWYVNLTGDYFRLIAKHSGKCLSVFGGSASTSGQIIQSDCAFTDKQLWAIPSLSHTPLQSKATSQCIDVYLSSIAENAAISQSTCHGNNNQQWTLMPYQDAYRIIAKHSGKCLAIYQSSLENNAVTIQQQCIGKQNELWYPKISDKLYRLVAKQSNKCLTAINTPGKTAGTLIQNACTNDNNQLWAINTSSTTGGKWSDALKLPLVPVAASTLPNGKLLLWSSHDRFSFGGGGQTYTAIFNPSTKQVTEKLVSKTGHDMFCPGTANLADGRVLVNGGDNNTITSIYSAATDTWTRVGDMNIPRGYQSDTVLSNGNVFTIGGSWTSNNTGNISGKDGEVWNSLLGWHLTPGILAKSILTNDPEREYRADNHPWLFSIANGRVFHAGPSKQMNWFNTNGMGITLPAGNRGTDDHSMNGNASMYDVGKILKVAGAPAYGNSNATKKSFVIDINNRINTVQIADMAYNRVFSSSVVLPDGSVIVFGGQGFAKLFTDTQPVFAPELWDPTNKTFTTLAAMKIPRTYHSVAILMPDASIFVAGGGLCGSCTTNHPNAEIFTPPYLLNGDGTNAIRPIITTAPISSGYGWNIPVTTNSAVANFALVRMSSITHAVNNDQRRIPLKFKQKLVINSYSLQMPNSSGIATPGYYMLFALNASGVPSVAKIIKLG